MKRYLTEARGAGPLTLISAACVTAIAWKLGAIRHRREAARIHRVLVELLLNVLDAGDAVTQRHSRRVAALTDALADAFHIRSQRRATLRVAALLHDMGKMDDRFFHILHKPALLSKEERAAINQHPRQSADILEPLESIHPGISAIVRAHHECWSGGGYPRGLRGDEIPLESRIISVADVFDALTQPRAYREPLSPEEALREIERGAGSRFDPRVVRRLRDRRVIGRWREVVLMGRIQESMQDPAGAGVRNAGGVRNAERAPGEDGVTAGPRNAPGAGVPNRPPPRDRRSGTAGGTRLSG